VRVAVHVVLFAAAVLLHDGSEHLLGRVILGPEPEPPTALTDVDGMARLVPGSGQVSTDELLRQIPESQRVELEALRTRSQKRESPAFQSLLAVVAWVPVGYVAGRLLPSFRAVASMPVAWVVLWICVSTWTWRGIRALGREIPQLRLLEHATAVVTPWPLLVVLLVSFVAIYAGAFLGAAHRHKLARPALESTHRSP
jgi:hypothetical protein